MNKDITRNAPAKINLFLHVTGKRDDGYHRLSSFVIFSKHDYDVITISPANQFSFTCSNPDLEGDDNLVVKAAQALSNATGQTLNCTIHLDKKLPIAGGIGGGSSDAATVIKALLEFWAINEPDNLDELLLSLGADVPVCYFGKPCLMRGIGEIIEPYPYTLPAFEVDLLNPGTHLSTKAIFDAYPQNYASDIQLDDIPEFQNLSELTYWLKTNTLNSLQATAVELEPKVQALITKHPHFARMSGSGPTVFSLREENQ